METPTMTDALTDAKAQSEQTTTDSSTTEPTCPICGQSFDHSFEERKYSNGRSIRDDAVICKQAWSPSKDRHVYIHIKTEAGR